MLGTMKEVTRYFYTVEEAEIEVECPWYAEEVVHEVLLPENSIVIGVLAVDDDARDPREEWGELCDDSTRQMWKDGDVWGYGVWVYDINGNLITRDDECWGFYGEGYARAELKAAFDRAVEGRRRLGRK